MPTQNGVFRFGSFEADLDSSELRRNGIRLKLQSQPFRVLALLLQRPGPILTREELQQELWPSATFVDYEQGLATAVNKARDALGDSSGDPPQEYFADGMTDDLIADLGRISQVRVISSSAAARYKGTRKAVSEIAR